MNEEYLAWCEKHPIYMLRDYCSSLSMDVKVKYNSIAEAKGLIACGYCAFETVCVRKGKFLKREHNTSECNTRKCAESCNDYLLHPYLGECYLKEEHGTISA